jgi:CelD/BcsL family acetyltransferase involved in cellulose biosynthesis
MYHWEIHEPAALPEHLSCWRELHARYDASPLLHPDFLEAALSAFGNGRQKLAVCRVAGSAVAAAVLEQPDPIRYATFQPSQGPIGYWLQDPSASTSELLVSLTRQMRPWILSTAITQQDPDLLKRPNDTSSIATTDYIDTARVAVSVPWDDYWKQRGANLRHNMKRAKSRLKSANLEALLHVVTSPSEMAEAVRTYGDIESRSWKAEHGTAVSIGNAQGAFYADMLSRFALSGRARCYQLLIGDRVAATDLCILGSDQIIILKTTFDSEFKDYSPAFLMRELAFERLFAEGWCRKIEFYGRLMDWHLRWTDNVRRMYHVTHFRYPGTLQIWRRLRAQREGSTQPA